MAALFAIQQGRCFWCGGALGAGWSREPVLPKALGGGPDHIVLAHRSCNRRRGARSPSLDDLLRVFAIRRELERSASPGTASAQLLDVAMPAAPVPSSSGFATLGDVWPSA